MLRQSESREWETREEIQSLRNMYTKHLSFDSQHTDSRISNVNTALQHNQRPQNQILKLKMRMQAQEKFKSTLPRSKSISNDFKSTADITGSANPHFGQEKDVSILLQEKKYWLSRIQDDNFSLISLLKVAVVFVQYFAPFVCDLRNTFRVFKRRRAN